MNYSKKNKNFIFYGAICSLFFALGVNGAYASEFDTEDPMYFEQARDFTFRGGLSIGDDILDTGVRGSYGINDIFVLSATVKYQQDFDDDRDYDGYSYTGMDVMYRVSNDTIKSDIFGGVKFSGDADPRFDKTIYAAGFRLGRSWDNVTLAGTFKTSWLFDEVNGMAWIDMMPEAYFKVDENWRIGFNADIRKATNPDFDATILGMKFVRQYGRTQYVGYGEYDFEQKFFKIGTKLNIAF